jgi:predicted transposase/invertase (TIGR01784 family)
MSEGYVKAYSDIFIKYLFGKEGNEDILLDFLNDVLTDEGFPKVVSVTVKNPFNLKDFPMDKESYLDLKVVDENGKHYNIEVQSANHRFFVNRVLFYWSKLYTSQIKEGEDYGLLRPTISINLLNFKFIKGTSDLHNVFHLSLKSNPELVLTNLIYIHFIEFPKLFKDKPIQTLTDLERWVYFFINEGKEDDNKMKILVEYDEPLFRAHNEYKKFTQDERLREIYEMRVEGERIKKTMINSALEKGIEKGIEKGRKEEQRQIAKKMLGKGLDINLIMEVTELSKEDIEKLKG